MITPMETTVDLPESMRNAISAETRNADLAVQQRGTLKSLDLDLLIFALYLRKQHMYVKNELIPTIASICKCSVYSTRTTSQTLKH